MKYAVLVIFLSTFTFSQTKMLINKTNGTTDSIEISEIEAITFRTSNGPVPYKNLVAWYPFNANADDESGNSNNGIVYGALLTSDRFGKDNSAFHFQGGAYVRIPELFPDSCSAFTFAIWVKKDVNDNGRHMIIYKGLQKGEASIIITPGTLGFGVNLHSPSSSNWYAANVIDTLAANKYYFLVSRYMKGDSVDLWINGVLVSSTSVPNLNLDSDPSSTFSAIGNHTESSHSLTDGWNGVIDDIRFYDRALSNEEIQLLFHEGDWNGN